MKVPSDFGVGDSDLTEMVVPNDLRSAREPEDRIVDEINRHGYSPDIAFGIKLALEEAITNAVKHGNLDDPTKHIVVCYYVGPERVIIMVGDEGNGFSPEEIPDPTAEENLDRPNGRGIMLMQSYMTKVRFNQAGNEVWLLKEK